MHLLERQTNPQPSTAGRKSRRRRSQQGFTFAEILAALLFMAILIPVVMQGLMIANRAAVVAERKTLATRLGGNLLNELIVTEQWQGMQSIGDFSPDWPDYRWNLTIVDWNQSDGMQELMLTVSFSVQGQEHSIDLSTLVAPLTE